MDNNTTMPAGEPGNLSFFERMVNVFTSPGSMYSSIAQSPVQNSSWVLPYVFSLIIAFLATFAILSDQALRSQALEPQFQQMQEKVKSGEMTQEQMDRAAEMMESSSLVYITGIIMALITVSVSLFLGSLIFWLAGKFILKSQAGYKKVLEIFGLAMLIGIAGSVVTLLLIFLTGSVLASPGASLLVMNSFESHNLLHMFLASINVATIWQMTVMGIGMAKTSGKSNSTGIAFALSLWFVFWVLLPNISRFAMMS